MDKRSLLFVFCVTLAFFGIHSWFGEQKKTFLEQTPAPSKPEALEFVASNASYDRGGEELYVLENAYQQLVFSTKGGSLAEINLPFASKEHPESIVKKIDIDRLILKQSPENAHFPLSGYYAFEGGRQVRKQGVLGGYYPLLRREQLSQDGNVVHSFPAAYYALAIVGENGRQTVNNFSVSRFEENLIEFRGSVGSSVVTKTYSLSERGPYCLNLDVRVDGDANGLWIGSGLPDVELVGGSYSPLLKIQTLVKNSYDVEELKLPRKEPTFLPNTSPNWMSNCNGFLGLIVDPIEKTAPGYRSQQVPGEDAVTRLSLIDARHDLYPAKNYPGYITYLPLKSGITKFRIFAGPFDSKLLKTLDEIYDEPEKNYNPDYADAQSIQGWFSFISQPFAKFLFFLMQLFYTITRSWAASIILLTIALRAMMYPLNKWSIQSTMKMQEVAPKLKALQEKYKKDPKRVQMETINLYRKEGVNPMMGCLPMLLQMPFLIGMFYLLKSSFALRGAMFIPGWIDNLAAPDVLFSWNTPLWFIGNEFHLLPILMAAVMFIQQRMSAKLPDDPKEMTEAQKQQRAMGNVMAVVFAVMFYNFPSGLNIYFMFSTLLGIVQQKWMTKKK